MSGRSGIVRRLTNRIVLQTLERAGEADREWALAMSAEIDAIEGDWAAFWFALGCWRAVWAAQPFAVMCRQGFAGVILFWASAKAYLVLWLSQFVPVSETGEALAWLPVAACIAGLAYAGAAVSLWHGRYRWLAVSLGVAWLTNVVLFFAAWAWQSSSDLWLIALAGEDLLFWSFIILGCEFNFFFGRFVTEKKP